MSYSIFISRRQVIHCLPCYPLLFHAGDAQYPSPTTCTPEVNSSITLLLEILPRTRRFDWLSASPRPPNFPPGFFNIFILLSQTGANGMCGQDLRIHHRRAEELAWALCVTCHSCQARCLPRFIIAPAPCCLSPRPGTAGRRGRRAQKGPSTSGPVSGH